MTVRTQQQRLRTRSLRPRIGRGARRVIPIVPAAVEPATERLARERDSGGPEDHALYHCHCGYVFEANVSATVGCPHCGDAQAW